MPYLLMTQNSRREIPQFNTPIVETHCHLDYLDSQALSETLDDAFRVGIERIVTISVSADNLDQVRTGQRTPLHLVYPGHSPPRSRELVPRAGKSCQNRR